MPPPDSAVEEAASLIEGRDPALAKIWREQPFNRLVAARAFARSLLGDRPADSDPHPDALRVLDVALRDKDSRKDVA